MSRLIFLSLFAVALHVARAQNPLADWVRKNRPDYRIRSNPNSFSLVGYVYPDNALTPPPLGRTQNCLNDPLRTKVLGNDAEFIATGESKVLNTSISATDIGALLSLTGAKAGGDTAKLSAELSKAGAKYAVFESGKVFEMIVSAIDAQGAVVAACADKLKAQSGSTIVLQALGVSEASYYFARSDKSKIQVGGALGSILASFGIGKEGQDTQSVEYSVPIYIGFVPARYCKATDDYRQKC